MLIDLTLAADNAVVVGLAAASLPPGLRRRAIWIGIAVAALLRIALSLVALELLAIIGLTLAGGILLLWVVWKLYREWRAGEVATTAAAPTGSLVRAIFHIVIADVSMSLDNVLAVAGAAREHVWVLVVGLVLSVALMGAASSVLVRLLARHRWIVAIGLAIIAFVAVRMIYGGGAEIWHELFTGAPAI
ncbi:MAG: YjbE family putative metal transport protein [Stellaceae bacterium]